MTAGRPPKSQRAASSAKSRRMLAEYESGASIRDIADRHGLTAAPTWMRIEWARTESLRLPGRQVNHGYECGRCGEPGHNRRTCS